MQIQIPNRDLMTIRIISITSVRILDSSRLLQVSKQYSNCITRPLERAKGVEPSSPAWEAGVITVIRRPLGR